MDKQHLFPRRSHAGRHSRRDRGRRLHSEAQRRSSDMNWYQMGSARVCCGVHESVVGTTRTSGDVRLCAAIGGQADTERA
jgi:hypothetical protein